MTYFKGSSNWPQRFECWLTWEERERKYHHLFFLLVQLQLVYCIREEETSCMEVWHIARVVWGGKIQILALAQKSFPCFLSIQLKWEAQKPANCRVVSSLFNEYLNYSECFLKMITAKAFLGWKILLIGSWSTTTKKEETEFLLLFGERQISVDQLLWIPHAPILVFDKDTSFTAGTVLSMVFLYITCSP